MDEGRRQFYFVLTSAAACALLAVTWSIWFRGIGLSRRTALLWSSAGVFCTPCWYYGTSTFDDILGATALVLAATTAFLLARQRPLLGGLLARCALAVHRSAEIIDDDLGAFLGGQHRHAPADPAACTGDDDDFTFQAASHGRSPSSRMLLDLFVNFWSRQAGMRKGRASNSSASCFGAGAMRAPPRPPDDTRRLRSREAASALS